MKTLSIGELAKAADVGIEAIRFYEKRELLPRPERSPAGYRRFPQTTVDRLRFIRRAKHLGFTLEEIAELLTLHDDPNSDRASVKSMTKSKLKHIEQKLADLERMRKVLSQLSAECSGHGPVSGCPIIEALSKDE